MRHRWTESDIEYVRRHYADKQASEIGAHLGVSAHCVSFQARIHGLRKYDYQYWSEDDLSVMRAHYGKLPNKELSAMLGRSIPSIAAKAQEMGLQSSKSWHLWTDDELRYLRVNYSRLSNSELSARIGMSVSTIAARANRLGLKKHPRHLVADTPVRPAPIRGRRSHTWTEVEVSYIMEHYPDESSKDIAEHLGLTTAMINSRAFILGVKKSREYLSVCRVAARKTKKKIISPPQNEKVSGAPQNGKKAPGTKKHSKSQAQTWDERVEDRHRQRWKRMREIERLLEREPDHPDAFDLVEEHRRLVSALSSWTVPERYRIDVNV